MPMFAKKSKACRFKLFYLSRCSVNFRGKTTPRRTPTKYAKVLSLFSSMSAETLSDTYDSSSLADPADFNRDSSNFPVGIKKRCFPEVYPEYAQTPSKRSKSEDQNSFYSPSSPYQKGQTCEHSFSVAINKANLDYFSAHFNRKNQSNL
jgi:hypothetical protein